MRRFLIIAGIVLGVLIVAILLLPLFINVDSFRPEVEKKLSDALGRQVQIGKISASIFSGGAEADNIVISDDPAFNKGPFLKASSLKIGLQMIPLIFSRQFKVESLTIKDPDILLLKNPAGRWNYSSLGNANANSSQAPAPGSKQKAPAPSSSGSAPDFTIDKFQIENGKIRVAQTAGHAIGKEHAYTNVNLTAHNIAAHSVIPFTLTALTPGGGALDVEGQAGPVNEQDSAKTPLDAKLTLKHADLAATGLFDPSLSGVVDFNGTVKSDGRHLVSSGQAQADKLKLVKGGSPAGHPIALDYKTDYNLDSDAGTIDTRVHTGKSMATANGTLNTRGENTIANVKVAGDNMAMGDVEGLLPAFGVSLPSGASLQGGTLNMDFNAEGPLDRLVINGPVKISNVHLSGYNLTQKLGAIAAFTGIKPSNDTLIQTLSTALRVAPEGIRADNILLDVPSIGQITGSGLINNNQALDFKMLLKLASGGGGMLGQLSNVGGGLGSNGIPFLIQGTTSNPTFLPSVSGIAGGVLSNLPGLTKGQQQGQQGQQQPGLGGILGGILNKKKKPQ